MTIENCIKHYKRFIANNNKKAAEDMKNHMLKSRKFSGHLFLKELEGIDPISPKREKLADHKIEVKKDGKKPKR